jgi:outer membrane protein assembly factor BamB
VGKVTCDPAVANGNLLFLNAAGELVVLNARSGAPVRRVHLPEDPRWTGVVASGDSAWVGSDGGMAVCVDVGTGRVLWSVPVGGAVRSRACLADGRLLVATSAGELLSLDPQTGREIGRESLGGPARRPPVALAAGWVALTEKGVVLRYDATGTLLWRYDAKDEITSAASVVGGHVVLATRKGTVVALRP